MTIEEQVKAIAQQQRLGVFFDNRERFQNRPWIFIRKNGMTLAEFHTPADALAWLPEIRFTNRASAHSFESENHV